MSSRPRVTGRALSTPSTLAYATGWTVVAALGAVAGCNTEGGATQADQREGTVHHFDCETRRPMEDGVAHTVQFSVAKLGKRGMDLVWPDEDNDFSTPIRAVPDSSYLSGLNENVGVRIEGGKLIIDGDSDGFYFSTLVLYENSGLTKGYVRLEDASESLDGGDRYSELGCTVTVDSPQEKKPRYELGDEALLGFYDGGESCPHGLTVCESAELIEREDGKWMLDLGAGEYWDGYLVEVVQADGVLVFTTRGEYESHSNGHDDCDNPGCGNVLDMSGVIYPKQVDGKWVPALKTHYVLEYPFPDEEDAPSGELRHVSRMLQTSE